MNTRLVVLAICYFATIHYGNSRKSEDKIIGGTQTNITEAPSALSYFIDCNYKCSAVIRNKEWAITAAHCVTPVNGDYSRIRVRSGSSYYKGGKIHRVTKAIIHEKYNNVTNDYDIAVLRVQPNFVFDDYTEPVDIAQDASETNTTFGKVCGWGLYNITTPVSETLECTILPHVNKILCQIELEPYQLTDRMTCYGYATGGEDTCVGDSGSGLVNDNNTLIGITSWGVGCAAMLSPGVYTDTVYLKDWIVDNTSNL